jgi:hypothetical protein
MNESTFASELESLINRHSMENASDTPDFILAHYLLACLLAWNTCVQQRESWHGRNAAPIASLPMIQPPSAVAEQEKGTHAPSCGKWAQTVLNGRQLQGDLRCTCSPPASASSVLVEGEGEEQEGNSVFDKPKPRGQANIHRKRRPQNPSTKG